MVDAWGALLVMPWATSVAWSTIGLESLGALLVGAALVAFLASTAPPPPSTPVAPQAPAPDAAPARGRRDRAAPAPPDGLVARLRSALGRSREALQGRFDELFAKPVDEDLLDELSDTLLLADVGVTTADRLVDDLRAAAKAGADAPALRERLRDGMRSILDEVHEPLVVPDELWVVLVVGVNGSGKTTTIGKLAARLVGQGKKVLLAAGDTYRAAAADQLEAWAERSGADLVRKDEGADPGAVVYEAMDRAKSQGYDALIIDTAGRLQTTKPLMAELEKLRRVIAKHDEAAPHDTLLVLDGTMGQNALSQATLFDEATPLTGVAITKLDGTAKGGMVLTIADELQVPVKLIGIGEAVDDLRDFEPAAFVEALG